MFKKVLISLFVLCGVFFTTFLIGSNTQAGNIKVENIFTDIDSDYKYLNELQTLYDRGMIFPDSEGRFNPRALLNRDEFVGILMEVTCKKCIQPNTTIDLINKFEGSQVFFDINKLNKYFYCVEEANDSGFVTGYHPGTVCENGVFREGEKPFCPSNTITLEEAIAVILRASGILTIEEAEAVRQDIYNGLITEDIALDVHPKNPDGSVYSFYPDLAKALTYEIREVDADGNIQTYTLIETKDGKLRPKQAISKEDFLRIAYVTIKANACSEKTYNALALEMNIYDKECSSTDTNCSLSDLKDESDTYDFGNTFYTTCESGVKDPEGYIRRFYNNSNGTQVIKYGNYIEDYTFLSNGVWQVFLRVIDNCGNTAEVHNTINISNTADTSFGLEVDATPVYGEGPLDVDLLAKPAGGEGPYTCNWDYGDGILGNGINVNHTFVSAGAYEVITTCTDVNGLTSEVKTTIYVTDGVSDTSFGLEVDATPVYGEGPLDVDLLAKPAGGEGPYTCNWDYGDGTLGSGINVNHTFVSAGTYEVITTCTDINGLSSVATSIIYVVKANNDLKVSINAEPIFGTGPLLVDFEGMVEGGVGPYSYFWDFGDGNTGYGENIENIFKEEGTYEVLLTVLDSTGRQVTATVLIQVIGENCSLDSDSDGINDCEDLCPLIIGDERNKGCPILERECDIDNDCRDGYICTDDTKVCLPKQLATSCEYTGGDVLFGNVVCNSCPCNNYLDFTSTLRRCDIIFPAITSPDNTEIYGKGGLFQIK